MHRTIHAVAIGLLLFACAGITGYAQEVTPPPPPPDAVGTKPPPMSVDKTRGIPSEAELQETYKIFKEAFKEELNEVGRAKRELFARKLLDLSGNPANTESTTYVLLIEAAKSGTRALDERSVLTAMDRLHSLYNRDASPEVFSALLEAQRDLREDEEHRWATLMALDIVIRTLRSGNMELCSQASRAALRSARRSKDQKLRETAESFAKVREGLSNAHKQMLEAEVVLAKDPSNTKANSDFGMYVCLVQDDWDKGLEYLAKGNDPELSSVAQADLNSPSQPLSQVFLADQYYKLATTPDRGFITKSNILKRAALYYKKAIPHLDSLKQIMVRRRIQEAEDAESMLGGVFAAMHEKEDAVFGQVIGTWRGKGGKPVYYLTPDGRYTAQGTTSTTGMWKVSGTNVVIYTSDSKSLRMRFDESDPKVLLEDGGMLRLTKQ